MSEDRYYEDDGEFQGKYSTDVDYLFSQICDVSDLYFLSLVIMDKLENSPKTKTIAELTYLLDNKSFLNLLWYFEGMTIRIPTRDELKSALQMICLYYYHHVLGMKWKDALIKVGVEDYNRNVSRAFQRKYNKFLDDIKDIKFPVKMKEENSDKSKPSDQ